MQFLGQGKPDLRAAGRGDPPLVFQHLPGHVHLLRADQGEHVVFAAVFADQRGGQSQSPPGLQAGRDLEHGCRQQMHLVVDDQPPVALVEQLEVDEFGVLAGPVGHDVVGGHGHRPDVLARAVVLADLVCLQRRLVEQFGDPLAGGGHARREDQCRRLHLGHAGHADDRLARPAGQHNHARPAAGRTVCVEHPGRLFLIVPQAERLADGRSSREARSAASLLPDTRPGPRPENRS